MTGLIPYEVDAEDVHDPKIRWWVSGNPETNQLHIKVRNTETGVEFEEMIDSPLLSPSMGDRIFGIDMLDSNAASNHSNVMWEKYKDKLLP